MIFRTILVLNKNKTRHLSAQITAQRIHKRIGVNIYLLFFSRIP